MAIEELTAKAGVLETRIGFQENIEEIKKVQRMYGYYVDNHMLEDAIEFFADDMKPVEMSGHGTYENRYAKERGVEDRQALL